MKKIKKEVKSKVRAVPMKVNTERCKGCFLCVEFCPRKVLAVSEHVNDKGAKYVVVARAEDCTGCGMCAVVCPDCVIEIKGS